MADKAITTTDYKALVTDYSAALTQLTGVADNYYAAAQKVLILNSFDPEIDLLIPFYNAYLTGTVAYASQPQSVVNAVKALQDHVLSKGRIGDVDSGARFDSVNDYYADDGTFAAYFTTEFASLSQQSGHTIEAAYIA